MDFIEEVNSHKDFLFKYLKKKNPDGRYDDFDDAIQAGFIKAFRYKDSFLGNCSIRTWITLIVSNCYTDIYRAKYNTFEVLNDTEDNFIFENVTEEDFSIRLCDQDFNNTLKSKLFYDDDANVYLQTFKLCVFDDLDYNQLSDKLNIPIGTVKSRMFKARKILQERYNNLSSEGVI
jgi:RNA polymerase sigma factor (sigma-70 family)